MYSLSKVGKTGSSDWSNSLTSHHLAPKKAAAKRKADLSTKTVAELKAMAKEAGISGYTSLKKAELIVALSAK